MHVIQLCIALAIGFGGYRRALWFEGKYGRTPWGWSPWIWGLLFLLGAIIGLVLIGFAERAGRRDAAERESWQQAHQAPRAPGGSWPGTGGRTF